MSSNPTAVELDFLGLDRDHTTTITTASLASSTSSKSQLRRLYDRQRSFREVQNAITKINPELLKASSSMAGLSPHDDSSGTSKCNIETIGSKRSISVPASSVLNPGLIRPAAAPAAAAPLTIFYNGTVSVFDLPQDKAEGVLKFVEDGWFKKPLAAEEPKLTTPRISNDDNWMTLLSKRRMLQRNVSLQRFLEKRKERLTSMPIHNNNGTDGNQKNKKKDNVLI